MNSSIPATRHPFQPGAVHAPSGQVMCAVCGLSRLTARHTTLGQNFDLASEKLRRARRRAK